MNEKTHLLKPGLPHDGSKSDDNQTTKSIFDDTGTENVVLEADKKVIQEDGLENWQVAVNLIKGSIGTGILGLPLAMKHAGIMVGPIVLCVMGLLSIHNMHILVICSRTIAKKDHVSGRMDYGELTKLIFSHYGGEWKKVASYVVNFFLCLVQLGFCCVYVLFVADNLYRISGEVLTVRLWATIALPAFIALCYIDHLKFISYISFASNFLALFGLAGVLADVIPRTKNPADFPSANNFSNIFLFFGQAVFAFEGIGVILPVEKKAKKQHQFVPVMYASILFVIVLYIVVAIFGYLAYPTNIKGSVTLNLSETPFHITIQAMYALAIYFTYFIQFYVPMTVMVPWIREKFAGQYETVADVIFRTICVVLTFAVAIGVPQLGNSIALVGSLAGSAVLFIFPAFLHILILWEDRVKLAPFLHIFKDGLIIIIGLIGAFAGTYEAVRAILGIGNHEVSPSGHKPDTLTMLNFTSFA